jgi:hypothetical protein
LDYYHESCEYRANGVDNVAVKIYWYSTPYFIALLVIILVIGLVYVGGKLRNEKRLREQ